MTFRYLDISTFSTQKAAKLKDIQNEIDLARRHLYLQFGTAIASMAITDLIY